MADTVKKAKAAAKPSKPAAKKTESKAEPVAAKPAAKPVSKPSHAEIEHLARKYWAERGHHDGHAEQDWLRAEHELSHAS